MKSLPTRGAWIEIHGRDKIHVYLESLPTRGAWIEIRSHGGEGNVLTVAPHTGSVD